MLQDEKDSRGGSSQRIRLQEEEAVRGWRLREEEAQGGGGRGGVSKRRRLQKEEAPRGGGSKRRKLQEEEASIGGGFKRRRLQEWGAPRGGTKVVRITNLVQGACRRVAVVVSRIVLKM